LGAAEGAGTDDNGQLPFVATAQYSSPEYLFRLVPQGPDLWRGLTYYQIGGVLHDLIMRRPLFADRVTNENKYLIAYAVANETPELHLGGVEDELVLLARDCLDKDLARRLSLVSWKRLTLNDELASLDAARKRLGLGSVSSNVNSSTATNVDEHMHNLIEVAKQLRVQIDSIFREEGFPSAARTISKAGDDAASLKVTFRPPEGLKVSREIELEFRLVAPLGSTLCQVECREVQSESEAIGAIAISAPIPDIELLRSRLTAVVIRDYEHAVSDVTRVIGETR
jgi:hypothetical protein